MINELFGLSKALDTAQIQTQIWHQKYEPIPKISSKSPCICITLSEGKVVDIFRLDEKFDQILRRYGSNQGFYPCMNLTPLYRITDDTIRKELSNLRNHPELLDNYLDKIESWCTENGWGKNFQNKYKVSMKKRPSELRTLTNPHLPEETLTLINETDCFPNASDLHKELEQAVWKMLSNHTDISLALMLLFYSSSKTDQTADEDYGSISVAFESTKLIDAKIPAVSQQFVNNLNQCLLDNGNHSNINSKKASLDTIDAFGVSFKPFKKSLPKVKLTRGFPVILRTMSHEDNQLCPARYGKIEDAGYPLSHQMRTVLKTSLEWIGSPEHEEKTWTVVGKKDKTDKTIKDDKEERLFVYPTSLPSNSISFVEMFQPSDNNKESQFIVLAEKFITELKKTKTKDSDSHAARIQLFIIQKIDSGRTKVVYTHQTDAYQLEKCSEEWNSGCTNLPEFHFGNPVALFPLHVGKVLNRFWKQNGTFEATKIFSKYRGLEILMDPNSSTAADLHKLSENAMRIGPFCGNLAIKKDFKNLGLIWSKLKDMLALLGLFLYRNHIRKDIYMQNLPYLYGQLLKAADELHALYCQVVRNGDVPPQLVGSSLFQNAAEAPIRTMTLLSQRIMPYYSWAKSYRFKDIQDTGKESWRAAWLYQMFENITMKLSTNWTSTTRFSDEEKAQLFIGYLADFPKKEKNNNKEDVNHEQCN